MVEAADKRRIGAGVGGLRRDVVRVGQCRGAGYVGAWEIGRKCLACGVHRRRDIVVRVIRRAVAAGVDRRIGHVELNARCAQSAGIERRAEAGKVAAEFCRIGQARAVIDRRVRGVALEREHEESLVAPVVDLWNVDRPVNHKARLAYLIVIARLIVAGLFIGVCVQIGVLENIVCRAVNAVVAGANHGIGYRAVAVADLRVKNRILDLHFLHRLGRRHEVGIARPREPLGCVVGNAVDSQAVMAAVAVCGDLHRDAAERIRVLARQRPG